MIHCKSSRGRRSRRGAVVPMAAICLVGLVGLTALAIDIGMIAVARSQCQNAADTAATAGCRTINGNSVGNYNYAAMPAKAITAAINNNVLGKSVTGDSGKYTSTGDHTYSTGQVKIESGIYYYVYDDNNAKNEGFKLQIPRTNTAEPYTAVRTTVTNTSGLGFGRIFGSTTFNASATATSVHRPRDVIIVMDLSGSMRFQSLPGINVSSGGTAYPHYSDRPRTKSMNPESVYPTFGHYSDTTAAALSGNTSYLSVSSEMVDPANISTKTNSGPAIAADFHQNAAGVAPSSGTTAFARAADSQASTPGGDDYLKAANNGGAAYGKTAADIVTGTDKDLKFERNGYGEYGVTFKGYTEGPGYWGKTFFIWPPDPRGSALDPTNSANHANNGAKDWRQRFFFKYRTSNGALGWLDHNNLLFRSTGAPADNSNYTPTPIIRLPSSSKSITENGASVDYQYRINYAAILHWLRNESPKPFPSQLRAGRIAYYDAIPDPSDANLNNRWWTTFPLTNKNERFWKDYIDFVLGLQGTGAGTYTNVNTDPDGNNLSDVPLSAMIGNGDYFQWGTFQVNSKPDRYGSALVNKSGGYATGTTTITLDTFAGFTLPENDSFVRFSGHGNVYKVTTSSSSNNTITVDTGLTSAIANNELVNFHTTPRSSNYSDNPYRPKHQFWFGPMTFIDYLGNYNTQRFWWPGNVHEAQCWACKVGIQTAIDDIKNNHPSDFLSLAFFSNPLNSRTDTTGQYNRSIVPLGRDYQKLKDSLWFPPSTVTGTATEITPYDADFEQVPRAKGGTAPGMGFMLAYNLLSPAITNLRLHSQPQSEHRGGAGGLGRKGASRIVVFETDGAPNTRANADMAGSGSDSYYKVRIKYPNNYKDTGNSEWPSGGTYSSSEVYDVVKQICKLETASPPGYSTVRKPALVYSLGYGSLYDTANPSTAQSDALTFLQTVAYHGNTASSSSGSSFPDSRRIYGTNQQRIDRIRTAFTEIMQNGVQVSLIE